MRCPSSSPSYQSGIGVRAIRMTARIAPTNAAAPMTANTFLLSPFFAALERERKIQKAALAIKKKYGKNAILKAMNLEEGATAKDRNAQIGGHKA
jgi:hypothetical protein